MNQHTLIGTYVTDIELLLYKKIGVGVGGGGYLLGSIEMLKGNLPMKKGIREFRCYRRLFQKSSSCKNLIFFFYFSLHFF